VERLELALKEMEKMRAAPEAHAEESARQVSETEPEARNMKQSDGGYALSHNVQISTDTAHNVIVGASVTRAANDQHEAMPAMEEVERQSEVTAGTVGGRRGLHDAGECPGGSGKGRGLD
jgi:hypothetical protein